MARGGVFRYLWCAYRKGGIIIKSQVGAESLKQERWAGHQEELCACEGVQILSQVHQEITKRMKPGTNKATHIMVSHFGSLEENGQERCKSWE